MHALRHMAILFRHLAGICKAQRRFGWRTDFIRRRELSPNVSCEIVPGSGQALRHSSGLLAFEKLRNLRPGTLCHATDSSVVVSVLGDALALEAGSVQPGHGADQVVSARVVPGDADGDVAQRVGHGFSTVTLRSYLLEDTSSLVWIILLDPA